MLLQDASVLIAVILIENHQSVMLCGKARKPRSSNARQHRATLIPLQGCPLRALFALRPVLLQLQVWSLCYCVGHVATSATAPQSSGALVHASEISEAEGPEQISPASSHPAQFEYQSCTLLPETGRRQRELGKETGQGTRKFRSKGATAGFLWQPWRMRRGAGERQGVACFRTHRKRDLNNQQNYAPNRSSNLLAQQFFVSIQGPGGYEQKPLAFREALWHEHRSAWR